MGFNDKGVFYNQLKRHPEIEKIHISDEKYAKLSELATKIAEAKSKEWIHKVDGGSEVFRQTNGLMGETAIEELLGINIVEWSVGESQQYSHPDIGGYAVGIKTALIGRCPLIPKKNNYAQIINMLDLKNRDIYICGLATPGILNVYQNDNYAPESVRKVGFKTAFVGFDYLLPVHSLDDLAEQKV